MRPNENEYGAYYHGYIQKVPEGTIVENLKTISKQIDESSESEVLELEKMLNSKTGVKGTKLKKDIQKSQISLKSKLKLSIPIFLFTRYETEIELGVSDKIPKNLKELVGILLK